MIEAERIEPKIGTRLKSPAAMRMPMFIYHAYTATVSWPHY